MDEKQIKDLLTSLLKHLQITPKNLTITQDEESTYQLQLDLDDQDAGILIGYHGDTVAALQLIVALMLYKQTSSWSRLIVNIGDYRQKRQESLEKMAQDTAQRVKFSSEPIALFNLNPFERRLIHMFLADHSDVITESEGEGRNRHLVVRPKEGSAPPPLNDEPNP
jgi:spoIIIJ-associated protein